MMLSNTKNQSNRSAAVDARPIQKEVVPGLVELEVAVPRLSPAVR
jgi:hypothetical protein